MRKVRRAIGIFFIMFIASSCSTSLEKDVSDCNCDDIWDMVEDKELLEIIEVWGQPEKRGGSVTDKKFKATWYKKLGTNCNGNDDCGEIRINWDGYFSTLSNGIAPLGTPTSIHCERGLYHD
jgi:hypothetical protein